MIVYSCKSDTISPAEEDDVILSVTAPQKSAIFAVAYGCTDYCRDELSYWLRYAKTFAFDLLLLCTIWAEFEHRRLIDGMDLKATPLWDGISHMNETLKNNHKNTNSLLTKQGYNGQDSGGTGPRASKPS
ncbi:hypothetical protein F4777DRAFT_408447 [Nemania sp. FL0916]|nr:hypothetical protein F4777DRAFT_408447 [Nemania sp. FL0916]